MAELHEDHFFSIPELDVDFIFRRRPVALPGDLRPTWRIGLLMLLLSQCCRQQRSSLTRLHVLNWAVRSEANYQELTALIEGRLPPDALIVRFEPAFSRAIDFAIGENLVKRVDGARVELTDNGKEFAEEILKDSSLYIPEKKLTGVLRQRASETLVDNIFGKR
ncbi:hypothetical protein GCM10027019_31260 [Melaminivora jejuensis]|uniref:hypothetical protein n=1 Tax=Melaminivora jejuensis TaxID=1267217 RepID=UPI001ADF2C50|nr:hypothetical protein [Melaminivora jejuensis]UHJ63567.1 hypothetical protein LVC68_08920 [Melaminivora jejuensis]